MFIQQNSSGDTAAKKKKKRKKDEILFLEFHSRERIQIIQRRKTQAMEYTRQCEDKKKKKDKDHE